ncbi:hypothetical protein EEL30_21375 [Brevibacillus laterosporus]|uniref:Uncharacterized protein n=1 Tax=Brevibacillus laterosporus TaxID=1465 RepID=A0A518VC94_BRELA|nr:hypothetical protein EEL30_21375 [Brevibacillus laterosporus]
MGIKRVLDRIKFQYLYCIESKPKFFLQLIILLFVSNSVVWLLTINNHFPDWRMGLMWSILASIGALFGTFDSHVMKGYRKIALNRLNKFKQKALLNETQYTITELFEGIENDILKDNFIEALYHSNLGKEFRIGDR